MKETLKFYTLHTFTTRKKNHADSANVLGFEPPLFYSTASALEQRLTKD